MTFSASPNPIVSVKLLYNQYILRFKPTPEPLPLLCVFSAPPPKIAAMSSTAEPSAFGLWDFVLLILLAIFWAQTLSYILRLALRPLLARAARQQQQRRAAAAEHTAAIEEQQRLFYQRMNGAQFEMAIAAHEPARGGVSTAEQRAWDRQNLLAHFEQLVQLDEAVKRAEQQQQQQQQQSQWDPRDALLYSSGDEEEET